MKRPRIVIPAAAQPGRPRDQKAHDALLDAALALVREVGYDALALEAVAARAKVGKATLYRRWSSKEALVAEAVDRIVRNVPVPDTGSVRRDLLSLMRENIGMYNDPGTPALLSGFVAAMARSAGIAKTIRSGFHSARRNAFRSVLKNAVERGELPAAADLELALDLLSGPLFYRALWTGAPVDERFARRLVNAVIRALGGHR
jgi:AcrR family transcriptional regulator